jgi:hypothetical protein
VDRRIGLAHCRRSRSGNPFCRRGFSPDAFRSRLKRRG